jgi:bifunctional aspartokinase / homoserine dehydrogenase 1
MEKPSATRVRNSRAPVIHKFGGASLKDAAAMRHAIDLVRGMSEPVVVVVSALAGVTDALLLLARAAAAGRQDEAAAIIRDLRQRHLAMAQTLPESKAAATRLARSVEETFDALTDVARGLTALGELTPRTSDVIAARGELLSATIFAAALASRGRQVRQVNPLDVIKTDGLFGGSFPDLALTERATRATLKPLLAAGVTPVVPGFVGAAPDGQVTTMGRGGSDLTATTLGRALRSREVHLWKDVPGILTADPKVVADARVLAQLNVREAAELAYYGAKVLHPRAIIPTFGRNVRVQVRPFADPASAGTEVSSRRTLLRHPVKALSAIGGQSLVTVTGNGIFGVAGIAARTFASLQREGVSASMISQASSEHSLCLCVPSDAAERASGGLEREFRAEIRQRDIDGVAVRSGVASLAVVGLGMAGSPGVAARIFTALASGGVNIIAIAQGSTEHNVSVVIDETQIAAAQRLVHTAFQLNKIGGGAPVHADRADVVILGFGTIGRELAQMIPRARRNNVALRIVGVIDRSGYVFDAGGLHARRVAALADAKANGVPLGRQAGGRAGTPIDALNEIARNALSHPIFVDATADDTVHVLKRALSAGMDLVLANKRPLTGPGHEADALRELAAAQGRRILHETTVGAGLPVIDTYYKLVDSGDRIVRIEGCPSGTLGFLFGEMGRGRKFSDALRDARLRGYTEPDPREDLSGMDVARKALILGRLLGYRGELKDVQTESLTPSKLARLPLDAFMKRLEEVDGHWRERVGQAREQGGVLRYRCVATRQRVRVGLTVVDMSDPSASLSGTDNQFAFTTARYKTTPLVISGPGAGPAVTAAGVLNDVLRLAL